MDIHELLSIISKLAAENGISKPFIVGGTPRDRLMGKKGADINDLDITTGDDGSVKLGELLADKFGDAKYRTYDDGHSSINIKGLRIDFSNNFVVPNIDVELRKMGVTDMSPMKREIYSRDFTINTLLEDLDFSNIYDLTGEAEEDIKAGLIKCPIDPEITISADPRRILRAIKFAIKYDFNIEDKLKSAMIGNRKKIQKLSRGFVQDRVSEIVRLDNDKGINMLIEYKLLPLSPLSKPVYEALIKRRELMRMFDE
jgi:poly(A) polymerase